MTLFEISGSRWAFVALFGVCWWPTAEKIGPYVGPWLAGF